METRKIHWYERDWGQCIARWENVGLDPIALEQVRQLVASPCADPKPRDAAFAIACILARRWAWFSAMPYVGAIL